MLIIGRHFVLTVTIGSYLMLTVPIGKRYFVKTEPIASHFVWPVPIGSHFVLTVPIRSSLSTYRTKVLDSDLSSSLWYCDVCFKIPSGLNRKIL